MRQYENIEAEFAQSSFRLFASVVRKRVNSFGMSDDLVLAIASNRIRAHEAEWLRGRSFAFWRPRRVRNESEEWIEVVGHELSSLICVAGEQEEAPVIVEHEYRVRYSYYRKLVERALSMRST